MDNINSVPAAVSDNPFAALAQNKIKRGKFFASLGISFLGFAVLTRFPFSLLNRKTKVKTNTPASRKLNYTVRINNIAVKRNKIGGNNA